MKMHSYADVEKFNPSTFHTRMCIPTNLSDQAIQSERHHQCTDANTKQLYITNSHARS